jgi:hypothetical protein
MNTIECVVFSMSALIRYPYSSVPKFRGPRSNDACAPSEELPAISFNLFEKVLFSYLHHLGAVMAASVGSCSIDFCQRRYLMADISLRVISSSSSLYVFRGSIFLLENQSPELLFLRF